MILVDTSVWIEFLKQRDESICLLMETYLEEGDVVAVSAVFGELLQGCKNEAEEKIILEFWSNLPKINEADVLIEAGKRSHRFRLHNQGIGLIDCYLLAICSAHKFSLWTLDKKLAEADARLRSTQFS